MSNLLFMMLTLYIGWWQCDGDGCSPPIPPPPPVVALDVPWVQLHSGANHYESTGERERQQRLKQGGVERGDTRRVWMCAHAHKCVDGWIQPGCAVLLKERAHTLILTLSLSYTHTHRLEDGVCVSQPSSQSVWVCEPCWMRMNWRRDAVRMRRS